ncbi:disease resistance protein-like [Dorcoceras hygrometricum]|nr:disease resistance protein-like [Dorcoceras hygrometricum]
MRAVKESVNLGQRATWQIKGEPLYHAQPISRWKSSVRDLQGLTLNYPSQLGDSTSTDLTRKRQHSLHQSSPSLDSENTAGTAWELKSVKTSHNIAQI